MQPCRALAAHDSRLRISDVERVDGIGLVSHLESVEQPWIELVEVRSVLDEYSVGTPEFYLYFPTRFQVLPKLRAFIEFARKRLCTSSSATEMPAEPREPKPRWKWDSASKRPQRLS